MDYTKIVNEIESASLFDLYRLNCVINNLLEDQNKIKSVRKSLKVGQEIQYFDSSSNKLVTAYINEIRRTNVSATDKDSGKKWSLPMYLINIDNVDTKIHHTERSKLQLDRNSLQVGEDVWYFSSRSGEEVYGKILKLNPKRVQVKVTSDGSVWNVPYKILNKVIEGNIRSQNYIEIEANIIE